MSVASASFNFAEVLRPGDRVSWPQGTGEPLGLTSALMAQAEHVQGITLMPGMVVSRTLDHPQAARFAYQCLNGAGGTRKAVAMSGGRVLPSHLSALPDLISSRKLAVDVVLIKLRPTDKADVFSLGVVSDFVQEMVAAARLVIAEVDERLPWTTGDALVPRDKIHAFTLADAAEVWLPDTEPSATDLAVAAHVAGLIPDRATVQFGVGGMPVAVARALTNHRDLGIHSGIIPDAAVDLIEAGVITNAHKGLDEGLTVTGGLFGTRRLFDFADGNPTIAMRRVAYTHSQRNLAQIRRFHSVNSAIAIDLSGQVNAEMAGSRYLGAVGGQVDFVRGGRASEGGRAIMALSSTTPDGRHSKIVANLSGQPVTTARSDIDLVVTEYGVADLWGLDLVERARALIAIAHPDFREALERDLARGLAQA